MSTPATPSTASKCAHPELQCGSGGLHLFCSRCGATWTAVKPTSPTTYEIDVARADMALTSSTRYALIAKPTKGAAYGLS